MFIYLALPFLSEATVVKGSFKASLPLVKTKALIQVVYHYHLPLLDEKLARLMY